MTKRYLLRATLVPALTFSIGLAAGVWVFSGEVEEADAETEPGRFSASTSLSDSTGSATAVGSALTAMTDMASATAEEAIQVAELDDYRAQAEAQERLLARLEELSQGWGRMQAELVALQQRVVSLERRPVPTVSDDATAGRTDAVRPRTPQEQRDALVRAGVAAGTADEILWRRSQVELDRLELRDQALREGWLVTGI